MIGEDCRGTIWRTAVGQSQSRPSTVKLESQPSMKFYLFFYNNDDSSGFYF